MIKELKHMFKKFIALLLVILLAPSCLEAAQAMKLGVVKFEAPEELTRESSIVTNSFIKNLSNSKEITVYDRNKIDKALKDYDLDTVSMFGRSEGCQYILLGSLNRDRDIVITVRVVDVQTSKVLFAMSEASRSSKLAALQSSSAKLGDRVRERLTGEFPKISMFKNGKTYINRGSSSGVHKGDFYRVFEEKTHVLDESGESIGRNVIDLALVTVKSVQRDYSVIEVVKGGGSSKKISLGNRVEPVSKEEAKNLINQKTFSDKAIADKREQVFTVTITSSLTEEELPEVRKKAEKGHPGAQNELGSYYLKRKDYSLAMEWFQKAAKFGNARAQNNLGLMYEHGMGVPQDYERAVEWYLKAAEQANASAENNLGLMFEKGLGVKQSYAKAKEWYEKASEHGNKRATYNLGLMYHNGRGVKKDVMKAAELYRKAAEKDHANAHIALGRMYANGTLGKRDYKKAHEHFQRALEIGEKDNDSYIVQRAREVMEATGTLNNLGLMYDRGDGVRKDYGKAVEFYRAAAEQGDITAQYNMGVMYENGRGVEKDYKKAVEWYTKAAEQGYAQAQKNLERLNKVR